MAIRYEVTKKLRGPTTIRTVGVGTANINTQAQIESTGETLTDVSIKRCSWSTTNLAGCASSSVSQTALNARIHCVAFEASETNSAEVLS